MKYALSLLALMSFTSAHADYPIVKETGEIKLAVTAGTKAPAPTVAKYEKLVTSVTCKTSTTKCHDSAKGKVCEKEYRHDQASWDYMGKKRADGFHLWWTNFSPVVCDSGKSADVNVVILQDNELRTPIKEALALDEEQ